MVHCIASGCIFRLQAKINENHVCPWYERNLVTISSAFIHNSAKGKHWNIDGTIFQILHTTKTYCEAVTRMGQIFWKLFIFIFFFCLQKSWCTKSCKKRLEYTRNVLTPVLTVLFHSNRFNAVHVVSMKVSRKCCECCDPMAWAKPCNV